MVAVLRKIYDVLCVGERVILRGLDAQVNYYTKSR